MLVAAIDPFGFAQGRLSIAIFLSRINFARVRPSGFIKNIRWDDEMKRAGAVLLKSSDL
jgi:hypothetical protein